jgi:glycosyltransferase involved in cell wall biosynthesis
MTKIKILFIIPSLAGGGAERVTSYLVNNLNKMHFDVVLVSITQLKNDSYIVEPNRHINLGSKRVLFSFLSLNRVIKSEKPDIIFSTLTYVNVFLGLLKPIYDFKSKLIARESTIPSINNKGIFRFFYNYLVRFSYKAYDYFVCQSLAMKNDLVLNFGVNESMINIIYNPVQVPINSVVNINNSNIPNFVTIAMLRPEKGIKRIIDALVNLDFPFQYHIIGSGPEEKNLILYVQSLGLSDSIFFHGFSNNPSEFLLRADLFLQGSFYEGFPNALLESCINGVPVFAFESLGGTNELIIEGVNGKIFTSKESFSNAIKMKLWQNFDKQKIVDSTKSKYSLDKIIAEYESLFVNVMNRGTSK